MLMLVYHNKGKGLEQQKHKKEIIPGDEAKQVTHGLSLVLTKQAGRRKASLPKQCDVPYLIRKGNLSKFFKAMPVPLATALRGSSATCTGSLVFRAMRLSSPRSSDPPPAIYIPVRKISAASSGGVISSAFKTAASIFEIDLSSECATS